MTGLAHRVMPPEWALHEATLLTWPHDESIWEEAFEGAQVAFARFASALSHCERVDLLVPDAEWENAVRARLDVAGADRARVAFHHVPSDDVWARDHGPTVVCDGAERVMVHWRFTAWGGKFPHDKDARIPEALRAIWSAGYERSELVIEGGALEVNGAGELLTTESVLLNPNRNPDWTREAIESELRARLGVDSIHWLSAGIEGDDTDGHIDDIARFATEDRILIVSPPEGHPDFDVMMENRARLESVNRCARGAFELVPLPVPAPIERRGEMLPASYANFYVANGAVFVPVFDQPADQQALEVIAGSFPKHRVVGIDARALVTQSGALHCVSQQLPASRTRAL